MTLVSPSQSQPGTEIKAANINDPVNQITAVVNGGLDDQNISSISGSKLAAGTVAYEKMSTPLAFSAYQSADQSITASTFTKVQLSLEEFDNGSVFDNTLFRFVAAAAGVYAFIGSVSLASMGDTNRMFATLYKNGAEFRRGSRSHASTFDTVTTNVVTIMNLSPGDYVELFVWQNSGGAKSTISGPTQTFFQGYRLR